MKRIVNETQEQYKLRRKNENARINSIIRGELVWSRGTYVKKDFGTFAEIKKARTERVTS
jgi:hypothetical protein